MNIIHANNSLLFRLILLVVIIIPIPFSCDDVEYTSSELTIESLAIRISIYDSLNKTYIPVDLKNDFINSDSKIKLGIYADEKRAVSMSKNIGLWHNTLFADPRIQVITTKVDKVDISANSDIIINNELYLASESLNDLFYVSGRFVFDQITINDFLVKQDELFGFEPIEFDFRSSFDEKISTKLKFQFIMNDGKIFELETPILNIN